MVSGVGEDDLGSELADVQLADHKVGASVAITIRIVVGTDE